jgi:hypoxanthine phosphoribosyltransferase
LSREAIARRIAELAAELDRAYARRPRPPVLAGVLNGSLPFLADLVRVMTIDVEIDLMAISSYDGLAPSGVVRVVKDLDVDPTERDVVIVEDIVDTGLTLNYLRGSVTDRGVASLAACALLDKAARRIVPVPVEYRGFEIPDVFVVGYGLDYQGLYRNVPAIYGVQDVARLVADPRLLVPELYPHT